MSGQQIVLEEWAKEDLASNGLSPRWIVELTHVVGGPSLPLLALNGISSAKKNVDAEDDSGSAPFQSSQAADVVQPEVEQEVAAEVIDFADAVDEIAVY